MTYVLAILGLALVLYLMGSLRVLRQYERGVVFLLGKFEGVRGPGLTLIFVPVQQMVRVSLRTVTMQIPSQKIITKDNVSIDIAAVAYYHISDPEKAVIVIENVYNAINQISQTTVRNVVGRFSLDQLLSDTASINLQIKNVIDGHTEPWGTQVSAVEIKDIVLPDNMQRAMAKEAEAERERRAKIVAAEGEYQAAVKLGQAADIITEHPVALQLRTLQTMAEISMEKNSTIICRRVVRVGWLSGSAEHLVNLPHNLTATCGCCRSLRRHTGSAAAAGATTRAALGRGVAPDCEAQAKPRVSRPRLGKLRTLVSSP
jgi:regulator of protease activity HflC (stomatin/prohibitin superfamily)